jgi:hypothetical protein
MEVERWKTTPFYQLVFANQKAAEKATIRLSFFAGIFNVKKYATKMLVN